MGEWQPIETAPKDRTRLLLWGGNYCWLGFWNGRSWSWDNGDYYDCLRDVTHWMPLPEPPKG